MSIQCHADIVQYEADILLPEDFYGDEMLIKRQSQESNEQQKIDELVTAVCHDAHAVYNFTIKYFFTHKSYIYCLMSCSGQSAFEWQSNFKPHLLFLC